MFLKTFFNSFYEQCVAQYDTALNKLNDLI